MGIINWMQNRLGATAKQDKRRTDAAAAAAAAVSSSAARSRAESCRQDQARDQEKIAGDRLLSIGTLGNESPPPPAGEEASSAQDVADFTIEEVKKLQEALNKLLRRAKSKSGSRRGSTADHDADEPSLLPLDRFLNCPSSLEVDRRISLRHAAADGGGGQNGEFSPDTQIILSKARDLLVNTSSSNTIKQRSFKFLLKKMFVCRGGFSPPPTLKDPVESRIEKLFRTMIHKRMNARPSNTAASSRKYYLEDKPKGTMQRELLHDDEDDENGEDIFKWDKTDSDFIVLEM